MLSGLKGIGKTAAYRALTEFDKTADSSVGIAPKDCRVELPKMNMRAPKCSFIFEYEMALYLFHTIWVNKKVFNKLSTPSQKAVKNHVETFWNKIDKALRKVQGLGALGFGLTLANATSRNKKLLHSRSDENKAIGILTEACNQGLKLRLTIDDPEDVFCSTSELDKDILGGLCLAAGRLNDTIPNLKVVVLMKTHVHDFVIGNTADLDKYPDACGRLFWGNDGLRSLIEKRINHFCPVLKSNWREVFLGKKLNVKATTEIFEMLFSSIGNGPRHLIRYIHLAANNAGAKNRKVISLADLKAVKIALSKESFVTFEATNNEEFPRIGDVIRAVFSGNPSVRYSRADFRKYLQQLILEKDFEKLNNLNWMQQISIDALPLILFRCGALALQSGKEVVLPYMAEYTESSFENAMSISCNVDLFVADVSS